MSFTSIVPVLVVSLLVAILVTAVSALGEPELATIDGALFLHGADGRAAARVTQDSDLQCTTFSGIDTTKYTSVCATLSANAGTLEDFKLKTEGDLRSIQDDLGGGFAQAKAESVAEAKAWVQSQDYMSRAAVIAADLSLNKEIGSLRAQISRLDGDLITTKNELSATKNELSTAKNQVATLTTQVTKTKTDIAKLQEDVKAVSVKTCYELWVSKRISSGTHKIDGKNRYCICNPEGRTGCYDLAADFGTSGSFGSTPVKYPWGDTTRNAGTVNSRFNSWAPKIIGTFSTNA